jgi:Undecaprenyl-phosphate galactose phosphotransferase WbaP
MDDTNARITPVRRTVTQESDATLTELIVKPAANDRKIDAEFATQVENSAKSITSTVAKRIFDVVGAVSIALVCAPVFVVIAIIIRVSGQPVVFSHQRVGKDRKMFQCYKFRSMVPDAEQILQKLLHSDPAVLREWRESHKLRDDPRITKFGEFLRKSSLDELPQLWNVLKGDMSLVGPRPIVEDELERYGNKAKVYLSVKPGMTGLWQIMGRSNVTYSRRVSLDTWYVRKQTVFLDAWILIRTAKVVFKRIGAH